ncbi:MAG: methyltransferase domain-containing protein [Bacteroidetes bacterium]|nr:methyltransferase domain-containing protein [Bacteroidota bacterium]
MKLSTLQLFRVCFPRIASFIYIREMQHLLAGYRTCLDVGCGDGSPVQHLDFDHTVGVEAYKPALGRARAQNTHTEFRLGRAQDISAQFSPSQFNCVALREGCR